MNPANIVELVAIGAMAGLFAGMFGVGGGVLMVPAMVLLLGFGQHLAAGTSLLVIIPTALVGALTHWRYHLVQLRAAALLAIGGVIGGVLGGIIAINLDVSTLRRLFVAYLVIVGVRLLWPRRAKAANQGAGRREAE